MFQHDLDTDHLVCKRSHNTPSHACAALQIATRTEYDKVIQETEGAYIKILESSQTLLTVLKRESVSIQKKRQTSS